MSTYTEAAEACKRHLKQLKGFEFAVQVFERMASIENAENEAGARLVGINAKEIEVRKRVEALRADETAILEARAQDLADHQKRAAGIVEEAEAKSAKIIEDATNEADSVKAKAKWVADADIRNANQQAASAIAERNDAQGKTAQALHDLKTAQEELVAINAKLEAARSARDQLLRA